MQFLEERWQSGRLQLPAKKLTGVTWSQGSNPCLSVFYKALQLNELQRFIILAISIILLLCLHVSKG